MGDVRELFKQELKELGIEMDKGCEVAVAISQLAEGGVYSWTQVAIGISLIRNYLNEHLPKDLAVAEDLIEMVDRQAAIKRARGNPNAET